MDLPSWSGPGTAVHTSSWSATCWTRLSTHVWWDVRAATLEGEIVHVGVEFFGHIDCLTRNVEVLVLCWGISIREVVKPVGFS